MHVVYISRSRAALRKGARGGVETEIIQRDDESDVVVGDRKSPRFNGFFFRHLFLFPRDFLRQIGTFIFIRSLSHKSSQLAPTLVRARQERKEKHAHGLYRSVGGKGGRRTSAR